MKKTVSTFIILLLVSMVLVRPVYSSPTDLLVDPPSIMDYTLQPETPKIIRPMAVGTFTDWTYNTLTVRADGDGTYADWTGRILTLNPNDHGTHTQWSSWVDIQPECDGTYKDWTWVTIRPDGDGTYTDWTGVYTDWDETTPDGDATYVSTTLHNKNETSTLVNPAAELRYLPISKVRVTIVAKNTLASDEQVRLMLVIDGQGYNGSVYTPTTSYAVYTSEWATNPAKSDKYYKNWTWLEINALRAGVRSEQVDGSWEGELRVTQLYVSISTGGPWNTGAHNDGTYMHWTGTYTDWDDETIEPHDGDDSYVSTTLHNRNETVMISGPPVDLRAFGLSKVRVTIVAKNTLASDEQVRLMLVIDGQGYYGATYTPTTSYAVYTSEWATNPATGNNWTWVEIFDLEAGVRSEQVGPSWTGELRVTQLYVSISTGGDYTGWNDWPDPNGDVDYVSITTHGKNETSTLSSPPTEARALSIDKVRVTAVVRSDVNTDESVRLMLAIDEKGYGGAAYSLTTTYSTYISEWTQNPATGSPWTWSNIDTLEAGLRSEQVGDLWTGEMRATQLYVSVLTGGLYTDYNDWPVHNGDTDYVFVTADALQQSSALPDHTSETWSIARVQVSIVARADVPTNEKVTIMLVVGGIVYEGDTHGLTTTYSTYSSEWTQNPDTNLDWTWSDVDALEAGITSKRTGPWSGELRVTQLYVKVIESGTYAHWNETAQDGDATYVSAISDAQYQTSTLQNHTSQTWSIASVQVSIVARTDVSPSERVTIMLVVEGTPYLGTTYTPTTIYKTYSSVWTQNPRYNIPWNWTAIDTLEAGVTSLQAGPAWEICEIRVTQLYVVVGESGTYTEWDEEVQNEDVDYVSATMHGMKESSALEDPTPHPTWTIARVRVVFYAEATVPTDEQVYPMLVIGGTKYLGTAYPLDTTYVKYTEDWGKNPSTDSYWTWLDIDSLEAGVESLQVGDLWTGELRVTQLYVEVAGPRFTVDIQVQEVTNLFGYDFSLNYTTATLTATSITIGDFLLPGYWERITEIDDDLGYVRYAVTQAIGELFGVSGSGTLATISFLVDSYGDSSLDLCSTELRDTETTIIHDVYDGYFSNKILGDVDGDGSVGPSDLFDLSKAYGSKSDDPSWDERCDLNRDGSVNASDLFDLSKNYGESI